MRFYIPHISTNLGSISIILVFLRSRYQEYHFLYRNFLSACLIYRSKIRHSVRGTFLQCQEFQRFLHPLIRVAFGGEDLIAINLKYAVLGHSRRTHGTQLMMLCECHHPSIINRHPLSRGAVISHTESRAPADAKLPSPAVISTGICLASRPILPRGFLHLDHPAESLCRGLDRSNSVRTDCGLLIEPQSRWSKHSD